MKRTLDTIENYLMRDPDNKRHCGSGRQTAAKKNEDLEVIQIDDDNTSEPHSKPPNLKAVKYGRVPTIFKDPNSKSDGQSSEKDNSCNKNGTIFVIDLTDDMKSVSSSPSSKKCSGQFRLNRNDDCFSCWQSDEIAPIDCSEDDTVRELSRKRKLASIDETRKDKNGTIPVIDLSDDIESVSSSSNSKKGSGQFRLNRNDACFSCWQSDEIAPIDRSKDDTDRELSRKRKLASFDETREDKNGTIPVIDLSDDMESVSSSSNSKKGSGQFRLNTSDDCSSSGQSNEIAPIDRSEDDTDCEISWKRKLASFEDIREESVVITSQQVPRSRQRTKVLVSNCNLARKRSRLSLKQRLRHNYDFDTFVDKPFEVHNILLNRNDSTLQKENRTSSTSPPVTNDNVSLNGDKSVDISNLLGDAGATNVKVVDPIVKHVKTKRKYITTYVPYNIDEDEFKEWKRIGAEESNSKGKEGDAYWVEGVVDKRVKNGVTQYLVKYMGYPLLANGQQWWHRKEEITGSEREDNNKIKDYEVREAVLKKFAMVLRKKNRNNFELKYPQYHSRKGFSKPNQRTNHSIHLDQLHRKESFINFLLDAHGQKPLYIVNWTNTYEIADPSDFMKRPGKWTEESRKSLSFEYLLSVDAPEEILEDMATMEQTELANEDNLDFKCDCAGSIGVIEKCAEGQQCLSKCPCVRRGKNLLQAKIVGDDLIFDVDSEHTIFFSCGSQCGCSDWCYRKIPSWGRQFPLILFYHENKGWGVHAACKIPKGCFLGMYTGVLQRLRPSDAAHYQFLFPTLFPNGNESGDLNDSSDDLLSDCLNYSVDSGNAGNEFSLINHSCNDGNVRAISFLNCNNTVFYEIGFISTRDIEFGEELTYNYMLIDSKKNNSDDSSDDEKPLVKCHCRPDCPNMVA